jgi:IgGFc binding protein
MRRLIHLLCVLPLATAAVFPACSSATDSTGTTANGGSGNGGSGGLGATDGGGTCDICTPLGSYVPCENGQPGQPIVCDASCAPGVGCVNCAPGATVCVGNEVHQCLDDGSGPGDYVETCDTAAGLLCGNGKCGTACEIAQGSASNVGCEFWAVDLDQQDGGGNDPASAPWGVVLSNATDTQANVTIEQNDAPVGQPLQLSVVQQVSVVGGGLQAIVLPTRELDCGTKPNDYLSPGTCLSSRAFRITSSAPIVVYQFNVFENAYSNDASLLLPTNALGKVHRIINWGAGHPILINFPGLGTIIDRSYVTIVGTEANTTVNVYPHWRIKGNPPIPATQPGGVITQTIGPFDVLNLETDDATLADDSMTMADLTGTAVESDKPVAVFSGVESTGAPGPFQVPTPSGWSDGDTCCLDHLEDQIFPAESVGSHYVITRSPVRSSGSWREPDVLRFMGVAEPTDVSTNLPAPNDHFTLQPGDVVTTYAQDNVIVNATKPVMVGQILVSQGYVEGGYLGDPSLTIFPPVEQYRTEYVILTPNSWSKNYVVVSAQPGSLVTLDGSPTTSCKIEPAGMVDAKIYESRVCPVQAGVHKLTGAAPFGIVAYGYGSAGSYAFAGGADVKKIYSPPPIK